MHVCFLRASNTVPAPEEPSLAYSRGTAELLETTERVDLSHGSFLRHFKKAGSGQCLSVSCNDQPDTAGKQSGFLIFDLNTYCWYFYTNIPQEEMM